MKNSLNQIFIILAFLILFIFYGCDYNDNVFDNHQYSVSWTIEPYLSGQIITTETEYLYGDTVFLIAIENSGYEFNCWDDYSTDNILSFQIINDKHVTAYFNETRPHYVGRNNSFLYETTEGYIGDNSQDNNDLSKPIFVYFTYEDDHLSIEDGYATRNKIDTEFTYYTIPYTNNYDDRILDFINIYSIIYRDIYGNTLYEQDSNYLDGSVGASNIIYRNACLAPMETGYFFTITGNNIFDSIYSIECVISYEEKALCSLENPNSNLILQNASITNSDFGYINISLDIKNSGSKSCKINDISYILLDIDSNIIHNDFLSITSPELPVELNSQENLVINSIDSEVFFGSGSNILFLINFEDVDL